MTSPRDITEEGKPPTPFVYGTHTDKNGKKHGFKYDVNKNAWSDWQFKKQPTEANGANIKGASVGDYLFPDTGKDMGFLRKPGGKLIPIKVPNAQSSVYPIAINSIGQVTGIYDDLQGFEWDSKTGVATDIACDGASSTFSVALNNRGTIIGNCELGDSVQGFVRTADGTFTPFHPKRAVATYPQSINTRGAITGYFTDSAGYYHGFVRTPHGRFRVFDAPGAVHTFPVSLNDSGEIVGTYYDDNYVLHSFAMTSP
jgi:hypothetical protein